MEVSPIACSQRRFPNHYVRDAWTKGDLATRANPAFISLGILTSCSLNRELDTVFVFGAGNTFAQSGDVDWLVIIRATLEAFRSVVSGHISTN